MSMTLLEVKEKWQNEAQALYTLLEHSPFKKRLVKSGDDLYLKYNAISGALHAFSYYSSKRGSAGWLFTQIETYKTAAQSGNEEENRRNLFAASVVQEMLESVVAVGKNNELKSDEKLV